MLADDMGLGKTLQARAGVDGVETDAVFPTLKKPFNEF